MNGSGSGRFGPKTTPIPLASATTNGQFSKADYAKLAAIATTRSHVVAYQSANVTGRASGTTYTFTTDTETRDVNGEWDGATGIFTSAHAGTFAVKGRIMLITPPDQQGFYAYADDPNTGVEFLRLDDDTQSGTVRDLMLRLDFDVYFGGAGGKFRLRYNAANGAASAQTVRGGAAFCWLTIREIP